MPNLNYVLHPLALVTSCLDFIQHDRHALYVYGKVFPKEHPVYEEYVDIKHCYLGKMDRVETISWYGYTFLMVLLLVPLFFVSSVSLIPSPAVCRGILCH